ncbi:hypothetical protein [Microbulbifer agarilyticus]|uniref:hypothetical protein n=1 Tax=Microbulbifer agarilyticus TaxID=260552 RepID=UPI001C95AADD|nr:hypothetical protein [Microbulbifer agarilyticus]MBY6189692.1 hypothetical protein [Microbulbifer agarilyticus]MCA0892221.1 hypothetical protein [Microbulbifer agarilyticus]
MKKLLIPAIAIAAIGGYFYYTNLDTAAPQAEAVAEEEQIVEEVEAAVAEAEEMVEETEQAGDIMASAEEDVFADVPEAMGHALDETSEAVAEEVAEAVEEAADEIDHSEE